jgi:plasmid stabilization system protein ParE
MRRPLAEAHILKIWDYIAEDSIAAGDDWVDHLDEQFRLLATQPQDGQDAR